MKPEQAPAPAPPAAVVSNPWQTLRSHTPARIALGRAGVALPTAAHLAFQLAHAQARDAVHQGLDAAALCDALHALGLQPLRAHSAAGQRSTYLQRPDLGRRLDAPSATRLQAWCAQRQAAGQPAPALALVLADGLSAAAVQAHAVPLVAALLPQLGPGWPLAPVVVAEQARVALGDEIGQALGADMVVVLIGERPGLSSRDSLGIYITWQPRPGRSNAERNCISNVRPEGLPCEAAAARLARLLQAARQGRLTGVALKDESEAPAVRLGPAPNCLLDAGHQGVTPDTP